MKYSVLMSIYYKENPIFFKRSLESLLKQTIPTNDIVIVCDGKLTNELNEIINEYDSKYPDLFNIFRYDENKGLGYALSQGIKLTKNDVVMRMDTDDVCLPHRAETQLPLMKKYSLVGSWITEFDGEETNIFSTRKVPEYYRDIYKFAKKRCPFNHPSIMFNKNVVIEAGNYQTLLYVEDYYLWIRILLICDKVYNVQQPLVNMRSGISMRARRGGKVYRKSLKLLRKFMLHKKMINWFEYFYIVLVQSLFLILPTNLKAFIYKKMLRKK